MRIALYHNLPSGGGKRALFEIVRGIAVRHQIDGYSLSSANHSFCDIRPHCRVHQISSFAPWRLLRRPVGRLNPLIRTLDILRLWLVQKRIAAQIDAQHYDLVFVHNCQYEQGPSLLRFLTSPSVYYCQEPPRLVYERSLARSNTPQSRVGRSLDAIDPLPFLYRAVVRANDRTNAHSASLVLVNSHYSRETIYKTYGVFARVGRLGVDTDLFKPTGLSKEWQVLSVGAITPSKGFDYVIRSIARIEDRFRPAVVIIGNDQDLAERHYLEAMAADLKVHVEFRIGVSDASLIDAYNRAILTVYMPVMEPFGFVPLESMACGTPVVGVCEAGVRETIVDGLTGILVERDEAKVASAITRLLSQPELAAEMGRNGRRHVEARWTWPVAIAELEEHLATAAAVPR